MMNRDLHRRMAAALAILLTTLLALCAPALAVVPTGSLTLTASYGTTPLVGAPFKLYLVAEHDAASDFALCGEFAGSSVDLSDLSTAGKPGAGGAGSGALGGGEGDRASGAAEHGQQRQRILHITGAGVISRWRGDASARRPPLSECALPDLPAQLGWQHRRMGTECDGIPQV